MNASYPDNDYRYYLQHSAKGTTWGDHKYIAIENGRYIYPEDVKRFGGAGRPRGRQRNITGTATVFKQNKGVAGYGNVSSSNAAYDRFKNRSSSQKMIDSAKASYVKDKNKAKSAIEKEKKKLERMNKIRNVLSKGLNGIFAESTKKLKSKTKNVENRLKKLRKRFDNVLKKTIG